MDEGLDPERDRGAAPAGPGAGAGAGAGAGLPADPTAGGGAVLSAAEAEFASFYSAETPRLVRFLLWRGAGLADAADLAQEAMIAAYRYWPRIHTSPAAWVRKTASRAYQRRMRRVREDPVDHLPARAPLLRTEIDLNAWEQRHDLLVSLRALPDRQRQVMAWSLEGFSPQQIAVELEMSPEAVRASLYKARRALAVDLAVTGEEGQG